MNRLPFLFLGLLFLYACAPKLQAGDKNFAAAKTLEEEALQIGRQVEAAMYELEQKRNQINVQGRALKPREMEFVNSVEKLRTRFENWKKNKVELPASADRYRGGSQNLLKIQQANLETIKAIQKAARDLSS